MMMIVRKLDYDSLSQMQFNAVDINSSTGRLIESGAAGESGLAARPSKAPHPLSA